MEEMQEKCLLALQKAFTHVNKLTGKAQSKHPEWNSFTVSSEALNTVGATSGREREQQEGGGQGEERKKKEPTPLFKLQSTS